MSGWDEGGVYYSDQAQFPMAAETANRHQVLQKFKEFIRNFQHKSQPNVFPYREPLLSNPRFLLVDLADLISYDPDQTLPQFLPRRLSPAGHEKASNESGEAAVIPITVRQLEAIVRLSEALARMTLSHVANDNQVLEAIRLFNNSTLDAARSGINQHINLTPELANEIKHAETQIKRRMGIGSHISERRLIDELSRMGFNEYNDNDELLSVKLEALAVRVEEGCTPAGRSIYHCSETACCKISYYIIL